MKRELLGKGQAPTCFSPSLLAAHDLGLHLCEGADGVGACAGHNDALLITIAMLPQQLL